MRLSYEDLTTELKRKKIRFSHQRLKILEYLTKHTVHPTVEQIYIDLQKEIPTLSKTTVYSTLNMLVASGLLRVINIEDTESRYDISTEDHGHFKCDSCGGIYDFNTAQSSISVQGLEGFSVRDKNVYFKGLCPHCLSGKDGGKRLSL